MLETLHDWDQKFFPAPWNFEQWKALAQEKDYFLLCSQDGFALYKLVALENLAHLLKIVILPQKRGKGLGLELLENSISKLSEFDYHNFYLEVEESNLAAQKIYKAVGFKPLHLVKNFYGQERHAWTMGFRPCTNS